MTGISNGSPVVTLTPAPVLDRTYFVEHLTPGGVNRADGVGEELAGKGINVSRGLHLVGIEAPGVVPIGNADQNVLERTGSAGMLLPLWIDGTLRVSTTIVEHSGPTTKINESPRPLSEEDWAAVIDLTVKTVDENQLGTTDLITPRVVEDAPKQLTAAEATAAIEGQNDEVLGA